MKTFFKPFILIILISLTACKQSDPLVTEIKLVWSDEFNGTELDLTKWTHQLGDGADYGLWRWGNDEEQYYKRENVTVSGGTLKIKAIAESAGGLNYTSGRIRTLNKGDFKYGIMEASIRMSDVGGLWHAFWMLPSNATEPWPISGEIDIMEFVGNKSSELFTTVHFADRFGNRQLLGQTHPITYDNAFHTYKVEWTENRIDWYYDDVKIYEVLRTNSQISGAWPFDAEFHLLLNTAIGGNLGGAVDNTSLQTARFMEVDYVRVYQRN